VLLGTSILEKRYEAANIGVAHSRQRIKLIVIRRMVVVSFGSFLGYLAEVLFQ
jgi:hypothetical protein